MKILYLHQHFITDQDMGGTRSFEFSKYLGQKGHEVKIITGKKVEPKQKEELKEDNIEIISTNTDYSNKMGYFRRILAFFHYLLISIIFSLKEKNVDVVFATSTPITVGFPGLLIKKIKGCKFVFEVRDIWPDVPIEMGIVKNRALIWMLRRFELRIYKSADHIIALSEGMREKILEKGEFSQKISVIPNIANQKLFDFAPGDLLKEKYNIKDKFVCIHPGTMGYVNGLSFVLSVAQIVKDKDPNVIFLLIGEGKEKEKLLKEKKEKGLDNVLIVPGLPKKMVVRTIIEADLGLMVVRNQYKILQNNSANKFFDFLAAKKPILINYGGWQKEVLETSHAGFSTLTPEEMSERIVLLKKNQNLWQKMSNNALKLAKHYSLEEACKKLDEIFEKRIW